ncbi:MAG TPA: 4a-hydroxytetrahydrobiopterin dehydratase [Pseudomonadales bacterium]
MDELAKQRCEPCSGNSPPVPESEWPGLLEQLPGWTIQRVDGVPVLTRTIKVKNFVAALELANRIGELAEEENHHPRLVVEWGRLGVSWWTHAIGGLHKNDFVMAARTDRAAG